MPWNGLPPWAPDEPTTQATPGSRREEFSEIHPSFSRGTQDTIPVDDVTTAHSLEDPPTIVWTCTDITPLNVHFTTSPENSRDTYSFCK
jgi:hypothetical protein